MRIGRKEITKKLNGDLKALGSKVTSPTVAKVGEELAGNMISGALIAATVVTSGPTLPLLFGAAVLELCCRGMMRGLGRQAVKFAKGASGNLDKMLSQPASFNLMNRKPVSYYPYP